MRLTKIYWKRFHGPAALFTGSVLGMVLGLTLIPIVQAMGVIDAPKIAENTEIVENSDEIVAISDSPEIPLVESRDDLPELTPSQRFASWGISGYMQSRKNVVYTFTDGAGNHYKTAEVEDLGYSLRPVSNCSVEFLPIDDAETVAATIFAENCTVRDFTRKALDLDTIPMMAEYATNADNLPSYY